MAHALNIQELGYQETPLGELTLRRRIEPLLGNLEVFEVKLGDEYLMSSLFTESERQLAILGLAQLRGDLDVLVGGLGLGYTALEVLKNKKVKSLVVVELFQGVIDWHRKGLIPQGREITGDARCELRQGDFFELAQTGFDLDSPSREFDAVLLDIDHSPEHFLDQTNQSLYTSEGLALIRNQLKPGGSFGLWSNDPAHEEFTERLRRTFGSADAHNIEFPNPYRNSTSVNSVYIARNGCQ